MHLIKSLPVEHISQNTVRHSAVKKLAISTQEGLVLVRWRDILRCAADSNYARIYLKDRSVLMVCKTLGHIQKALPARYFFRVHQSHLVSVDAIRLVGRDEVTLDDDTHIPLSRSGRKQLLDHIHQISEQL